MELSEYLPILLFIAVGAAVGVAPQLLGFLLNKQKPDAEKNAPYECGFDAFEDARIRFDIRYYLIAILFILFDLEIAFLLPWALNLKGGLTTAGFICGIIFIIDLVVGFIYAWYKGALDWE